MTKKVFLDPGHGGKDPGAVGNGLQEKAVALKIAKYAESELKTYEGVSVKMSRTGDTFPTLDNRTDAANNWDADVYCSIHLNAAGPSVNGYEDFIYPGSGRDTQRLQDYVHAEVMAALRKYGSVHDRGQKTADYHVLRETKMPAILTENLFITATSSAKFIKNENCLKAVGVAHAKGIARFLGVKKKAGSTSGSGSSSSKGAIYRVQVFAGSEDGAEDAAAKARKGGFKDAYVKKEGSLYKTQVFAGSASGADDAVAKAKKLGFKDAYKERV